MVYMGTAKVKEMVYVIFPSYEHTLKNWSLPRKHLLRCIANQRIFF